MNRLFVTGDMHCNACGEFSKLNTKNFPVQKELSKDDYILIAGDFGCIWNGSTEEEYWLDWLENKPFTTLFVDGNHENHARLAQFPVEEWHGGKVHRIQSSILHLMRGQIFDIADLKVFAMGGASSHDIRDGILDPDDPFFRDDYRKLRSQNALFRIKGWSWWPEEIPSQEEYDEAEKNLDANGRAVDLIVSHCAPSSISDIISGGMYQLDELTDYFEKLRDSVEYKGWIFGHYHDNQVVQRKHVLLYDQVCEVFAKTESGNFGILPV